MSGSKGTVEGKETQQVSDIQIQLDELPPVDDRARFVRASGHNPAVNARC